MASDPNYPYDRSEPDQTADEYDRWVERTSGPEARLRLHPPRVYVCDRKSILARSSRVLKMECTHQHLACKDCGTTIEAENAIGLSSEGGPHDPVEHEGKE